jgi:glutathione S-transferase
MTDLPILYSFRRCPYAMRARMAIAVSGIKVELREVVLRDKPSELLEVSPKGTVPVLLLSDGQVLEESLDIMHWTLAQNDPEHLLASVDDELIAANDGPFKQALDRYKYPQRYGLSDGSAHREDGLRHLIALDDALSGIPFLAGQQRGFTDIALFPFVRQFAATDQAWFDGLPLSGLQAWLVSLTRSALFRDVMVRYPRWTAGDKETKFP